jgi:hypothetical protein
MCLYIFNQLFGNETPEYEEHNRSMRLREISAWKQ